MLCVVRGWVFWSWMFLMFSCCTKRGRQEPKPLVGARPLGSDSFIHLGINMSLEHHNQSPPRSETYDIRHLWFTEEPTIVTTSQALILISPDRGGIINPEGHYLSILRDMVQNFPTLTPGYAVQDAAAEPAAMHTHPKKKSNRSSSPSKWSRGRITQSKPNQRI
jgi:hypothetical protein